MRYVRYFLVLLIVVIIVASISIYTSLKIKQKKVLKDFYNALIMLQKSYPYLSFTSNKSEFYKMLNSADDIYQEILTYDFDSAEKKINKMFKFAKSIVEKRKSTFVSEAHISDYIGDVHILGGGSNLIKAEIDTKIRNKDIIKCGNKSSCKIAFIDGSIFTLQSNTTASFDKVKEDKEKNLLEIQVRLLKGAISVETLGLSDFDQDFSIYVKDTFVKFKGNTSGELEIRNSGKSLAVLCYDGKIQTYIRGGDKILDLSTRLMTRINLIDGHYQRYTIPPAPRAEEPLNMSTIDRSLRSNIVFKWTPVFNVAGYVFQLAKDEMFATIVKQKRGYSGTTLILPVPENGTYFWRVAAINDVNERGAFSEKIKFTILSGKSNNLIDNIPPKVEIDKINVFGSVVIVTGKTEPGATLIINNHLVEVDNQGKFSFIQKMYSRGKNAINIIARDAAGNETKITRYAVITVY